MKVTRALVPALAGLVGLAGSLLATLFLYRAAAGAIDRVLEERLRGAGETAAGLLSRGDPAAADLRAVMDANALEGAYVVSPALVVLAEGGALVLRDVRDAGAVFEVRLPLARA